MTTDPKAERHFRITNNNAIDLHVGKRLRLRRTLLGMSQEQLGAELNITFQQVQKYERGANRIGASRLFDLSRVLDVPVSFFFDDGSNGHTSSTILTLASSKMCLHPRPSSSSSDLFTRSVLKSTSFSSNISNNNSSSPPSPRKRPG